MSAFENVTTHVSINPECASVATIAFAYAVEDLLEFDTMDDTASIGGGHGDFFVALYDGKDMAAYAPLPFTAGRIEPARWFDSVADAPSLYVPTDAGAEHAYNFRSGGTVYQVKRSGNGKPVMRKFTRSKFFNEFVKSVIDGCIYKSMHRDGITAESARGMRYVVKLVRDIEAA